LIQEIRQTAWGGEGVLYMKGEKTAPGLWPRGMQVQAVLVLVLFLGSLAVLLLNAFTTVLFPEQELLARTTAREASHRMAESSNRMSISLSNDKADHLENLDAALREITTRVLADFPGVEGGFYLAGGIDRFSGYATGTPSPHHGPPRNEPPPLEAPYIQLQARQSLVEESGQPLISVRDVGPSRVLVVTEPIGLDRPARATTWAMFRLTGPEQLHAEVRRYQVSLTLALVGMMLSLALMVALMRSLTRQRLAQERLRNELRRSEQLAALGKLVAGVAHEIRNPLAGIRSTIQLWDRMPETARTKESMEAVIQAVDRLNNILSRLLYFARAGRVERQPVDVNQILATTFTLLEAQAKDQRVTLELDVQSALPAVFGSVEALREVFLNLATNGLQAMPEGGCLRCRSRYLPQDQMIEVRMADTGPGVSLEDRTHLFEPFFTTRSEGTGLGLALCREIIEQHEGRIDLVTEEGSGATFCVMLPSVERRSER
jgi:two-component system sensor histidine kinase HydH